MSKMCPKCRRKQKDERLIACPECKAAYVDEDELLTNFTRDELKVIASSILKDPRVYVVAGIFLAIGVGLLYWQIHAQIKTQIQKFQAVASNDVVIAYSQATNQLAVKFEDFAEKASNQIASAYSSVTNEITEEFQTPRVKQTVEDVAKEQAKEIMQANVQPEVERFRTDAEFLRLVTRAQAYDFKAYQQLLNLHS